MTALALIFTLAAIGISETVYLIKKRRQNDKPVCFIGEDCHAVLESKWNKILGIRNDILGLFYYLVVSAVAALLVLELETNFLNQALILLLLSGAAMSVYFSYLQGAVIKKWCFWCLMSAFTTWTMLAILIIDKATKV